MSGVVDLLIVGTGPVGAALASAVREEQPTATITMIDVGLPVSGQPGEHLHNLLDVEARAEYTRRIQPGGQAAYLAASRDDAGDRTPVPGVMTVDRIGSDAREFPSAAISWNVGGMGIHWTVACPEPAGSEKPEFITGDEWETDLETARRLLAVSAEPYGWSPAAHVIVDRLRSGSVGGDRPVGLLPMAGRLTAPGRFHRAGPRWIFPELAEPGPHTTLIFGHQVMSVVHNGARATGVVVRDLQSDALATISARRVVVCADALRTPQLLFASGIRPPALGRFLNEHAFYSGSVEVEPQRIGLSPADVPDRTEGDSFTNAYWVPFSDKSYPFMGQMMEFVAGTGSTRHHRVGLTWYVPTDIDPDNSVSFSQSESDVTGMPRMSFRFRYSDRDRAAIELGAVRQREVGNLLGDMDATGESALQQPGASLHYTGTVRMGVVDDGTSVCDPSGRVWGFENLFVAGNGVVPTALACNSTLPAVVLAMRTARSISAELRP